MKAIFALACLVVAVRGTAFISIPALKNEVESVLSVIVTAIQGDASQFAQDLMALDSATTHLEQLETMPNFLAVFIDTYQVCSKQLHQIAAYATAFKAKNQTSSSEEISTPNKFMNLFLSTLDQVANTMDNVVASLETLLGEINGVIQIEPEFPENAQGEHLIPSDIVNSIVATISQISAENEQISTEINAAVNTANDDLSEYISSSKPISTQASLMIEVVKVLGEYISDVASFISSTINSNTASLPISSSSSGEESINIPQLLQKLNAAFSSFKHVYKSLGTVFSTLEDVTPIAFAALNAVGSGSGNGSE